MKGSARRKSDCGISIQRILVRNGAVVVMLSRFASLHDNDTDDTVSNNSNGSHTHNMGFQYMFDIRVCTLPSV